MSTHVVFHLGFGDTGRQGVEMIHREINSREHSVNFREHTVNFRERSVHSREHSGHLRQQSPGTSSMRLCAQPASPESIRESLLHKSVYVCSSSTYYI
jgi:hypothetical protein